MYSGCHDRSKNEPNLTVNTTLISLWMCMCVRLCLLTHVVLRVNSLFLNVDHVSPDLSPDSNSISRSMRATPRLDLVSLVITHTANTLNPCFWLGCSRATETTNPKRSVWRHRRRRPGEESSRVVRCWQRSTKLHLMGDRCCRRCTGPRFGPAGYGRWTFVGVGTCKRFHRSQGETERVILSLGL